MRANLVKLSLVCSFVIGCSSPQPQSTAAGASALTGPIELRVAELDDDPADVLPPLDTAVSVVVTIDRIEARIEDGRPDDDEEVWTTVSTTATTVDLLSLQGGTFATLGVGQLPAGGVEALRLFLSPTAPSYVVTADGVRHGLVLARGTELGIRVVGDLDVGACAAGHVTLAFEVRRSIVFDVPGGPWFLRPIIRIREVVAAGVCPADGEGDGEGKGEGHDRR